MYFSIALFVFSLIITIFSFIFTPLVNKSRNRSQIANNILQIIGVAVLSISFTKLLCGCNKYNKYAMITIIFSLGIATTTLLGIIHTDCEEARVYTKILLPFSAALIVASLIALIVLFLKNRKNDKPKNILKEQRPQEVVKPILAKNIPEVTQEVPEEEEYEEFRIAGDTETEREKQLEQKNQVARQEETKRAKEKLEMAKEKLERAESAKKLREQTKPVISFYNFEQEERELGEQVKKEGKVAFDQAQKQKQA